MKSDQQYRIDYRINNNKKSTEQNHRPVQVEASPEEIRQLTEGGCLIRPGQLDADHVAKLREAVTRVEEAEVAAGVAEHREGNGLFLRMLQEKDPAFRDLMLYSPMVSIARAVLGPQIAFEVDARIAYRGRPDHLVPWHIHRRVVPDPLPPFFCYPHGVHCLIYLDEVGPDEGPLVYLPGSHRDHTVDLPFPTTRDLPGQVVVEPKAGDMVLIHANLWHRTLPTSETCGSRRLLIIGCDPAWLRTDNAGDLPPERPLTESFRESELPELRELAYGFQW
ncbi:phytanoyl-CoA dioxygenase family protein [Saccharopolyspora spinosa]|uniref:Phytanoyl-CoA dioxygenase PhyH n=1 Tax=Saccharopolyspora spinosa TaxID=60894 RepID=A0A2N3Y061_SACSN|nr:phytanoyl-CoA dioxygenase family protein [Saccharopolyspora spinosa]PKW16304.1 phytanoyl-CoA dioxygenase PhyH [Saccharopolyspora spinosa]